MRTATRLSQIELSDATDVGLQAGEVLDLVVCLAGISSAYALPVAFLFGVVAAVSRLSADAEVLALRSLGVGIAQFTIPFLGLAFAGWALIISDASFLIAHAPALQALLTVSSSLPLSAQAPASSPCWYSSSSHRRRRCFASSVSVSSQPWPWPSLPTSPSNSRLRSTSLRGTRMSRWSRCCSRPSAAA